MFADLTRGVHYLIEGIRLFYTDRSLWKYALIPMAMTLLVYLFFMRILWWYGSLLLGWLREMVLVLPSWAAFAGDFFTGTVMLIFILVAALVIMGTAGSLYEIFGGLFFDSMVERFERKHFGYHAVPPAKKDLFCFWRDSLCWGTGTLLLIPLMLLTALLIPFFGKVLLVIVLGYRVGISSLFCAAFCHRQDVRKLRRDIGSRQKFMVILGFGVMLYLLTLIPFLSIIVLPGAVLGGSLLYNKELKGD